MTPSERPESTRVFELVRQCVSRELQPGASLPDDDLDLLKKELVDSMGWVGILTAIEEATGIRNFGNPWPEARPQSIRSLVEAIQGEVKQPVEETKQQHGVAPTDGNVWVSLVGWGDALGSLRVEAATLERECGLAEGTILHRAGIECVSRADEKETEASLGLKAARLALHRADTDPEEVDVLIVTSATFLGLPSLAAVLHTGLLLRESCGAVDVGGACVGVVHALATAKALLLTARHKLALVVASEVHSRRLSLPQVPGEFRGLFGDGACAFVLSSSDSDQGEENWRLGEFIWGCSGTFASSLRLHLRQDCGLDVEFKGEQLGGAALTQLGRVMTDLENRSGRPRSEVDHFAIHEPNPRLVEIFAQKAGISMEKIALISKNCGNLGSVTCGVSLCTALSKSLANRNAARPPLIFIAAIGPGLMWGGTYLH